MTTERGGLEYPIRVRDEFSTTIQDFRNQLTQLRREARTARGTITTSRAQSESARQARQQQSNARRQVQTQRQLASTERARAATARRVTAEQRSQEAILRRQATQDRTRTQRQIQQSRQRVQAAREEAQISTQQSRARVQAAREVGQQEARLSEQRRRGFREQQSQANAQAAATRSRVQQERLAQQQIVTARRRGQQATQQELDRLRVADRVRSNSSRETLSTIREADAVQRSFDRTRQRAQQSQILGQRRITERTRRQNVLLRNQGQQILNNTRQVRQQITQLRLQEAQQRRLNRLQRQQAAGSGIVTRLSRSFAGLAANIALSAARLVGFIGLFAGITAIATLIGTGARAFVEFNAQVEQAQLGIASLLTAVGEVSDAQGRAAEGPRALALAQEEARRQTILLRRDGLQTAATFEQLLETFQQAIGPGLQAGLDVDQIRQFSVRISQAASAIGVPQNQLAEEIRSLLAGTINPRTTRIATSLGITNEDIRRAREAGTLVDFLNQRFAAFDEAGRRAAETFNALTTNVADALRQLVGTAGAGTFQRIRRELIGILDLLTIRDDATGALLPDPELVATIEPLFQGINDAISGFRREIGDVRRENIQQLFTELGSAIEQVGIFTGRLVDGFTRLGDPSVRRNIRRAIEGFLPGAGAPGAAEDAFEAGSNFADRFARGFRQTVREVLGPAADPIVGPAELETQAQVVTPEQAEGAQQAAAAVAALRTEIENLTDTSSFSARGGLREQTQALEALRKASETAAAAERARNLGISRGEATAARGLEQQATREAQRRVDLERQLQRVTQQRSTNLENIRALSAQDRRVAFDVLDAAQRQNTLAGQIAERTARIAGLEVRRRSLLQAGNRREAAATGRQIAAEQERNRLATNLLQQRQGAAAFTLSQAQNQQAVLEVVRQEQTSLAQVLGLQGQIARSVEEERRLRGQLQQFIAQAQQQRNLQVFERNQARVRLQNERALLRVNRQNLQIRGQIEQAESAISGRRGLAVQAQVRTAAIQEQIEQRRLQLEQQRERLRLRAQDVNVLDLQAIAQAATFQERLTEGQRERLQIATRLTAENDPVIAGLRQQLALTNQLAGLEDERAERQRLLGELTGSTTGGTELQARSSVEGVFGTAEQNFAQFGQALGGELSSIIQEAIVIEGQERGEVLNSYRSLFGAIGGIAQQVLRRAFSTGGILRLLGTFFAPVGVANQILGFAQGGQIPSGPAAASPAHFSPAARGLNMGGLARPAGLPASDTVPIWATPGEFMQPVNAVRAYGPQVMEAIRRVQIDPFTLKSLAGVGRTIRMPTGGFQTGGGVAASSAAPRESTASPGPMPAFIVSSPEQVEALLAGAPGVLEDYVERNAPEFQRRLGI